MAWPRVQLALRRPRPSSDFCCASVLRRMSRKRSSHGTGVVAAGVIENAVDQDARHWIAAGVGEHGDADIARRHQAQQRAPAEPAAGVPDRALLPGRCTSRKPMPVMPMTELLEFRRGLVRRVAPASPGSVLARAARLPSNLPSSSKNFIQLAMRGNRGVDGAGGRGADWQVLDAPALVVRPPDREPRRRLRRRAPRSKS